MCICVTDIMLAGLSDQLAASSELKAQQNIWQCISSDSEKAQTNCLLTYLLENAEQFDAIYTILVCLFRDSIKTLINK